MIIGAHVMLNSRDEKADKAFIKDILKLSSVDAGEGFLIFALPPAEVAVHASENNDVHHLTLMCDNIRSFEADMKKRDIAVTAPVNRGWGTMAELTLPGGGKLSVYEPHHKRPTTKAAPAKKAAAKKKAPARKPAKKAAKKKKKAKRR